MKTQVDRSYQGHKDRAHWSVALYLDNEYQAYKQAQDILDRYTAGISPGDWDRCRVANRAAATLTALYEGMRTHERFAFTRERVRAWVVAELEERLIQARAAEAK